MQHRGSGLGRPSGTDGSDFSYRMVVDSREFYVQFAFIYYTNHFHFLIPMLENSLWFLCGFLEFLGYQNVAKGKSKLYVLVIVQVFPNCCPCVVFAVPVSNMFSSNHIQLVGFVISFIYRWEFLSFKWLIILFGNWLHSVDILMLI